MIRAGRLEVLALYPDEDLTAWRAHAPQVPSSWINAYDKGCVVREKSLSDLHAVPALYLLDSRKRVRAAVWLREGTSDRVCLDIKYVVAAAI